MVAVTKANQSQKKTSEQHAREYLRNSQTNSLRHRAVPLTLPPAPPWETANDTIGNDET